MDTPQGKGMLIIKLKEDNGTVQLRPLTRREGPAFNVTTDTGSFTVINLVNESAVVLLAPLVTEQPIVFSEEAASGLLLGLARIFEQRGWLNTTFVNPHDNEAQPEPEEEQVKELN